MIRFRGCCPTRPTEFFIDDSVENTVMLNIVMLLQSERGFMATNIIQRTNNAPMNDNSKHNRA